LTLEFPNRSRSFDEVRNAVRFMGHDGMIQVPFFVEADALATKAVPIPRKTSACRPSTPNAVQSTTPPARPTRKGATTPTRSRRATSA